MVACDMVAAFLALFTLKPLAKRTIAQENMLEQQQKVAAEERVMAHA